MADEQTRLLQEILDILKEQSAVANKFRVDALAIQHSALNRQRKAVRVALVFMVVMIGLLVYTLSK